MAERIGIIGGGIAGLACAFRLTQSGHEVELFESSDQLGGLGTFFPYKDRFVDRFYHCIMPGDAHLLSLISDLGLADLLYALCYVLAGIIDEYSCACWHRFPVPDFLAVLA